MKHYAVDMRSQWLLAIVLTLLQTSHFLHAIYNVHTRGAHFSIQVCVRSDLLYWYLQQRNAMVVLK